MRRILYGRRLFKRSVALALLTLCACQSPTQIQVAIDGDDTVWDDLRTLQVRVFSREPNDVAGETERQVLESRTPGSPELSRPFEVPLAPRGRDASRRYRIEVTAELASGDRIVARAISGYQPAQTRTLTVYLSAECLNVVECDADETCERGVCLDAVRPVETLCLPGTSCGDRDAGVDAEADTRMDAGPDEGTDTNVPDAGICPPWPTSSGCNVETQDCPGNTTCLQIDGEVLSTACVTGGSMVEGDGCRDDRRCTAGLECVGPDQRSCRAQCHSEQDCSCPRPDEQVCWAALGPAEIGSCFERCTDAVGGTTGGTSCWPSEACLILHDRAQPICARPGITPRGEVCEPGSCQAGHACLREDGTVAGGEAGGDPPLCRRICRSNFHCNGGMQRCEGAELPTFGYCVDDPGTCPDWPDDGECSIDTQNCEAPLACGLSEGAESCFEHGSNELGSDCRRDDDCDVGSTCDLWNGGTCRSFCYGQDACTCPNETTQSCIALDPANPDAYGACHENCSDPLTRPPDSSCEPGRFCVFLEDIAQPTCERPGGLGPGAECDEPGACQPTLVCVNDSGGFLIARGDGIGRCRRLIEVGGSCAGTAVPFGSFEVCLP